MKRQDILVSDLMTSMVTTITERMTVHEARAEMEKGDIRHLPVVDQENRVVGILSDRDLIRSMEGPLETAMLVKEVMTQDVLTVRPESQPCEATALMLDHKIGAVPVVSGDMRLVGLVTETDFLRIAHRALGGDHLISPESP